MSGIAIVPQVSVLNTTEATNRSQFCSLTGSNLPPATRTAQFSSDA